MSDIYDIMEVFALYIVEYSPVRRDSAEDSHTHTHTHAHTHRALLPSM